MITMVPMTRTLCRRFFFGFESDPAIYMDLSAFKPFVYSDAYADAYFDRQVAKGRLHFAILENGEPVGEMLLKDIDRAQGACTLSIHLQNDRAKGRGIGTEAERLLLRHAFETLHMQTVYADTVLKNTRSQHVLEKVGFRPCGQDDMFCYYVLHADTAPKQ